MIGRRYRADPPGLARDRAKAPNVLKVFNPYSKVVIRDL